MFVYFSDVSDTFRAGRLSLDSQVNFSEPVMQQYKPSGSDTDPNRERDWREVKGWHRKV